MNNSSKQIIRSIAGNSCQRSSWQPCSPAPQLVAAPVVPIKAKYQGKSYSDWQAAWWQWLLSLPVDGHPGTGQSGLRRY
jgi:hypothetical protein